MVLGVLAGCRGAGAWWRLGCESVNSSGSSSGRVSGSRVLGLPGVGLQPTLAYGRPAILSSLLNVLGTWPAKLCCSIHAAQPSLRTWRLGAMIATGGPMIV